jgi:hypothetical protein
MTFKYTRLPQEEDVHPINTRYSITDIAIPQARQHMPTSAFLSDVMSKVSVLYLVGFTKKSIQYACISSAEAVTA